MRLLILVNLLLLVFTAAPCPAADGGMDPDRRYIFETMPPFIVNLKAGEDRKYLHCVAVFELERDGDRTEFRLRARQIRDDVLTALTGATYQSVSTVDGKNWLKSRMIELANRNLNQARVLNVYFDDFIAQ